ncbi:MAG TPA: tRNA pseudouridine synthase A, partial [Phaeodactylibacter sp.]|nr:tRNA pseudouridine synthase A [Phaeodactylibacter sp.]
MRYFVELAYKGTPFHGWQTQPQKVSVQEVLEDAFSRMLRIKISIVGCGRTDAGVHASQFIAHFDYNGELPRSFVERLNKYLPPEIVIYEIREAPEDMHARFDAKLRGYTYRMIFRKNPFLKNLTYYYPYPNRPDFEKMQEAANLLLGYSVFFPFCKSNSDAKTMNCRLQKAIWKQV